MEYRQPYAEKENEYILKNCDELGPERIAKNLGRTTRGIISKKERLFDEVGTEVSRDDKMLQFYAAIKIIKDRNIKHENTVSGILKAVQGGWLDDIQIKIV